MSKLNNEILSGTKVKLRSKRTNSIYQVTEIFKNIKGESWAECTNIASGETSNHPVYDLIAV